MVNAKSCLTVLGLVCGIMVLSQAQSSDSVFMFSYFKGNGQDGLHLAFSRDGFDWNAIKGDSSLLKPTVAKDRLMRDPCIVRGVDDYFHMVWTVSWNDRGIGYSRSKDLVNWETQRFIPVMIHEDSARNCWAPEITYDRRKQVYMIYWATTIKGKYPTDPKVENGYNHRMYYTLTKDFNSFSPTKLLYDKGFNVIDATIQFSSGRYIMFLKDETREPQQKNIRIATSKRLNKGFSSPGQPITGNYWAEGPTVARIGGTWVVYFDMYRDHKYGAVQSKDLKFWEDVSEKIRLPEGMRHGTIFKISNNEFQQLLRLTGGNY